MHVVGRVHLPIPARGGAHWAIAASRVRHALHITRTFVGAMHTSLQRFAQVSKSGALERSGRKV